ncbi:MAG TPA: hypothetical protein ENK06_12410 [Gammaproteobacteria bacterium]|nr:hypothetical protein [Gammaproteobacteria bacterium]
MTIKNRKLSKNFALHEFLTSSTAQRFPEILADQYDPPENVVSNLSYLCNQCLQPIRDTFRYSIRISSGYRCEALNMKVGSTNRSQHLHGQAADCAISDRFLNSPRTANIRRKLEDLVLEKTGRQIRGDVNANYYLFIYVCLRLHRFDIDQVIHEYGTGPGNPAWVHIACSPAATQKGQILAFGRHFSNNVDRPDLNSALRYGTA